MPTISRDGVRIAYEVHGAARRGLPLLLTHGYGESAAMWAPNVAALSAGRPVITWDMRGHGASDSPEDQARYTQQACLDDMAALLDAAGADRAVLGGLSLGGYLSLAFRLARPERVAALLLFDTGPGIPQRRGQAALERAGPANRGPAGAIGPGGARPGQGRPRHADPAGRDGHRVAARGRRAHAGAGRSGRHRLPGGGELHDREDPDGDRWSTIPDAGHIANRDQPAAFNEAVTGFLAGLGARRASRGRSSRGRQPRAG